jgi:hypothetical protein
MHCRSPFRSCIRDRKAEREALCSVETLQSLASLALTTILIDSTREVATGCEIEVARLHLKAIVHYYNMRNLPVSFVFTTYGPVIEGYSVPVLPSTAGRRRHSLWPCCLLPNGYSFATSWQCGPPERQNCSKLYHPATLRANFGETDVIVQWKSSGQGLRGKN